MSLRTTHLTSVLAVEPNLPAPAPNVLKLNFFDADKDWQLYKWLTLRITADFNLTDKDTIVAGKLTEFELQLRDLDGGSASVFQTDFAPPMIKPIDHDLVDADSSGTITWYTQRS